MIEDRDYMRQPGHPGTRRPWSATTILLAAFAAVFVAEIMVSPMPRLLIPDNKFCYDYFALSLDGLKHWRVWQLLTYQFMHAGLWHILGNSLAIYFFGRELEMLLGWKKYLTLFFSSGVVGGIFQVLTTQLWPQIFPDAGVVGASAGAFGLVAAFALIYPDRELMMLAFFVIPVRMRAKTLLILSAVLAVAGVVFSESIFGGNVANAAHIGGMLTGIFYVRKIIQGNWFQWKFSARGGTPRELAATPAGKGKFWRSAARQTDEEVSTDQFLQKEVDPILDKISAHGIQSLTASEREILEKARAKMAKR
jgi:membrane associated rhomboid family serine protease